MARIPTSKTVATITHDGEKRKNIPTAEHQSVVEKEQAPKVLKYPRNTDLDPQLVWRGKDEQDWSDLVVHAPPLYIQEKVHPKVLIDDLLNQTKATKQAADQQFDLFSDFNGIPDGVDKTEFYQHDQNWTNRMILGDSLQVMASLAEREGLRGKVQCIYFDPPYGIKFNSNFQWSTTSRDVKDGKADHITREPEQVKAFRDTWRDGIHSYLTYLRDRLTVARDLLADSGSIFVQIGDENVHRVRAVMDEVLGDDNFVSLITLQKTGGLVSQGLTRTLDYICWYAKDYSKAKIRQLYLSRQTGDTSLERYDQVHLQNGEFRRISSAEQTSGLLPEGARRCRQVALESANPTFTFEFQGKPYTQRWKTNLAGLKKMEQAGRIVTTGSRLNSLRYVDDFPVIPLTDRWESMQIGTGLTYVVQTAPTAIQNCILMTTDPGDLVLDPTCGSGTTAFVAEHWGRRWITIDTSRVALALARARIMGARYPFYLLADSRDGQLKEAEVTRSTPSSQPTHGNIRHGFVYERVPHITLKSIANNTEIDVIWDKWQTTLEPLREQLNTALNKQWEEWEIPREADANWPDDVKPIHGKWWQERIARQQEIDASIVAKAESEYLYDKPYSDAKKVRVAGPFTVESVSPHRVLGVDENDELIDPLKATAATCRKNADFAAMILENLKTAGVQQAHKEDKIGFTSLTPWPGALVCAEATYLEGDAEKRAGIFIGPEFGTVQRADLVEAARECGDAGFDVLIACAFNFDAHSSEFAKLGRIPILKARMNADLHMADDLKNTGKGNLFVIFGEPDIDLYLGGSDALREKVAQSVVRVSELNSEKEDLIKEKAVLDAKKKTLKSKNEDSLTDAIEEVDCAAKIIEGKLGEIANEVAKSRRFQAIAESIPDEKIAIKVNGVDVFHPQTGEVRSDGSEGIACWFIDTDYNGESFFVRHAYFLGANDPYSALKTTLKAEVDADAWATLHSDISRPFDKPDSGRIAVKVINHLGDEVMKVFRV